VVRGVPCGEWRGGGRVCRRDKRSGKIVWVSPGLVFPIVGAMCEFVQNEEGPWVISKSSLSSPLGW